ncbi:MAG: restriction endonuclease subunit S [Deltaproteobacteria bacterium]|nr:restriction endonuclease subunit S [Deltaproteobacteria bacterium]OEU45137.1 MAG: hypothetical protein BBJ60_06750 [Desulfobacterales bacterium S7086C20]
MLHAKTGSALAIIYYYVASPVVQEGFEERAAGTTNQIELNTGMVRMQAVPLPPLAEQKRIVAKVDQLMSLCDELEAKLKQSQSTAERLMGAVVNELSAA